MGAFFAVAFVTAIIEEKRRVNLMFDDLERIDVKRFFEGDKFIPARMGQEIMTITRFISMKDNNEIWAYNKGIWRPDGEVLIRNIVTQFLGEAERKTYGEEVVYYIRTMTYTDRDIFDMPKNLIPLENGILDIETEELSEYTTHDFFTFRLPVFYDKTATCPKINSFLQQVVKPVNVLLLKEIAAYCLLRDYPIQTGFMVIGEGSNGKSKYLGLIKAVFGKENIASISLQDIEEKPFAMAYLFHKIANIYADLSTKSLYNTGRFKILTGGDMVTAEKKFLNPFNFVNYAKMIFSCNQIPIAYDDSAAFHRRWIIVNFPYVFDEKTADPNILEKITDTAELSGFLNELILILKALLTRGRFDYEMTIEQRRELYKRLSDPVEAFCMDNLEFDSDGWIGKRDLYTLFCRYCRERNYTVVADNTFSKHLFRIMEISQSRKTIGESRVLCYTGLKLREKEDNDVNDVRGVRVFTQFKTGGENVALIEEKTMTTLTPLPDSIFAEKEGLCDICKSLQVIIGVKKLRDDITKHLTNFNVCEKCYKEL